MLFGGRRGFSRNGASGLKDRIFVGADDSGTVARVPDLPATDDKRALQDFFREVSHLLNRVLQGDGAVGPLSGAARVAAGSAVAAEGRFVAGDGYDDDDFDDGEAAAGPVAWPKSGWRHRGASSLRVVCVDAMAEPVKAAGSDDFSGLGSRCNSAEIKEQLRQISGVFKAKAEDLQPGCCGNTLQRLLSYSAAVKAAMGAAALFELVATSLGADLADTATAGAMIPIEVLTGLLVGVPLCLPFYGEHIRKGLIALGLATPENDEEETLRAKFERMGWPKYCVANVLAIGFGLTQAGMVGAPFYLKSFFALLGWEGVKLLGGHDLAAIMAIGVPLLLSNYTIGVVKADDLLTWLGWTEGHPVDDDAPPFDLSTTLMFIGALLGVTPNILGSGGLFTEMVLPRVIIGLVCSLAPIGLNHRGIYNLIKNRNELIKRFDSKASGFAGAGLLAAFSAVFTFSELVKTFDPAAAHAAVPDTDDPALKGFAVSLTIINAMFLTITKGESFSKKYADLSYANCFEKLYGVPLDAGAGAMFRELASAFRKLCSDVEAGRASPGRARKKFRSCFKAVFFMVLRSKGISPTDKVPIGAEDKPTYAAVTRVLGSLVADQPLMFGPGIIPESALSAARAAEATESVVAAEAQGRAIGAAARGTGAVPTGAAPSRSMFGMAYDIACMPFACCRRRGAGEGDKMQITGSTQYGAAGDGAEYAELDH